MLNYIYNNNMEQTIKSILLPACLLPKNSSKFLLLCLRIFLQYPQNETQLFFHNTTLLLLA